MEKRFVNRVAIATTLFTILMLAWILAFQGSAAINKARYQQMSGLERLKYYNSNLVEHNPKLENHIRIAIPKGVSENDITFENEYARKKIMIHIPRANEGFLFKNPIVGSSNGIVDLVAENTGDGSYIEISLDSVYEQNVHFENGYMYVGFDPIRDVYQKIVVVDAGHGDGDPGSLGGDVYEADIDLAIAKLTKEYLEKNGIKVLMTRQNTYNTSYADRVNLANEVNAVAFISVHNNASKYRGAQYVGTQTLYNSDDETGASQRLAELALDYVSEAFETRRLVSAPGQDIYIIRNSKVPMTLVEVGFVTTDSELKKLLDPYYQEKAAKGIGDAVLAAYEEGTIHD